MAAMIVPADGVRAAAGATRRRGRPGVRRRAALECARAAAPWARRAVRLAGEAATVRRRLAGRRCAMKPPAVAPLAPGAAEGRLRLAAPAGLVAWWRA